MRSLNTLMVTIVLTMLSTQAYAEGFYKWKDVRGNTQYGDQPPANVKAENMKMPDITVIEGFSRQWQPLDANNSTNNQAAPVVEYEAKREERTSGIYTKLAFVAPKNNQVMSGGFKGEVSAMLSIKPPLKKGHQIAFMLNGKEVSKSKSRISNFTNLGGGTHTISASIVNSRGTVLKTSTPVSFKVVRKRNGKKNKVKPQSGNNS
ncbi:MAG: DUF4124 domain-containing protein [Cocleimonas sp.]|nr:DUF4124 domain-containing protein [Cocleimonas sp.]